MEWIFIFHVEVLMWFGFSQKRLSKHLTGIEVIIFPNFQFSMHFRNYGAGIT